ncbi:MAG: hydroxyacid dehydrogenase [Verrucomicrobia bacterium]|jgi:phosphoglycerate dehydrogenase-like enzyme|nr:hydroxyacid dehydrogenase [Verrucomicrobiota bacterium]
MRVWSNTKTLDGHVATVDFTDDKTAADVILVGGRPFDLDEFPRLRGIFKTGVGRDNIPEEDARVRGIRCGFPSKGTCSIIYEETATFTCHLIFRALYSRVGDFASWTKVGRHALATQKLLVLGTGNIGRQVAAKMQPFLEVLTFDPADNRDDELVPLMMAADCITLHMPLIDKTRGFIDAQKLGWMNDGAALVNTARGHVVNEEALYQELLAGRLRAAFDVFWEEPYVGRLLKLPPDRFLVSPHVASTCFEFIRETANDFRSFLHETDKELTR